MSEWNETIQKMVDSGARGRPLMRTGNLRMFAERPQMPQRLQEEWMYLDNGERLWRNIPIVIGDTEVS